MSGPPDGGYRPPAAPGPAAPPPHRRGPLPFVIGGVVLVLVAAVVTTVILVNRRPEAGAFVWPSQTSYSGQPATTQSSSEPASPSGSVPASSSVSTPASPSSVTTSASPPPSASKSGSPPQRPTHQTDFPPGPPQKVEKKPGYHYQGRGDKSTALYNVTFKAGSQGCGKPKIRKPPIPDNELKGYVQQVVRCMVGVLKKPLAEQGITLTTPAVRLYSTNVSNPCQVDLTGFPAYYCSGNHVIYVNSRTDDNRFGYYANDKGYWDVIGHEFGHHLQAVAGVFASYAPRYSSSNGSTRDELARRLELQATCFGGVFFNATYSSTSRTVEDYFNYAAFLDQTGEETHGSGENQDAWFDRGYLGDWSSYGDCNTWTAKSSQVS